MKIKRITLSIGQGFLTAFVNADESGLSDLDKKKVTEAIDRWGPYFHVYYPDEATTSFCRCAISGLMDDCYTCEVEVSK